MKRELRQRLSFEDAAFLNFERPSMPMNIGSVGIYDSAIPLNLFVAHVDRRIDLQPRYRHRVVPAPLNLEHPAWMEDPDFNVGRHIAEAWLPPPGNEEQLQRLAGQFFARPLKRDKPLWEMLLVQGLHGDRTAHLVKAHHCMADGVSGVGLLAALLDLEPRPPRERRRARDPAPPLPSSYEMLAQAWFDSVGRSLDAAEELWDAMLNPARAATRATRIARALEKAAPYFLVPAQPAPWNGPLTSPNRMAWQVLPFEEVRAVAHELGGTINDVVLTVIGGALGRYLRAGGHKTEDVIMRAAAPVNVRREEESADLGNRVSFMLVGLPVGQRDPVKRFRAIHQEVSQLKAAQQAAGVDEVGQLLKNAPPLLHFGLGSALTSPNLLTNLICTNVPGPLVPLYCMGHRMVAHYPWVPLGWRMQLSIAIMSYDRGLYFSVSGDERLKDEPCGLADALSEEFSALREMVLSPAAHIPDELRRAPAVNTGDQTIAGPSSPLVGAPATF